MRIALLFVLSAAAAIAGPVGSITFSSFGYTFDVYGPNIHINFQAVGPSGGDVCFNCAVPTTIKNPMLGFYADNGTFTVNGVTYFETTNLTSLPTFPYVDANNVTGGISFDGPAPVVTGPGLYTGIFSYGVGFCVSPAYQQPPTACYGVSGTAVGHWNVTAGTSPNTVSIPAVGLLTVAPEPASLLMIGGGLAALALISRRRAS